MDALLKGDAALHSSTTLTLALPAFLEFAFLPAGAPASGADARGTAAALLLLPPTLSLAIARNSLRETEPSFAALLNACVVVQPSHLIN